MSSNRKVESIDWYFSSRKSPRVSTAVLGGGGDPDSPLHTVHGRDVLSTGEAQSLS